MITSSDDEHDSHFLLPGFFKTIVNNRNNEKDNNKNNTPASPLPDEDISQISDKSTPSSTPPRTPTPPSPSRPISEASSFHSEQPNVSSSPLLNERKKPSELSSSPQLQQQNGTNSPSLLEKKHDHSSLSQNQTNSISQDKITESPTPTSSTTIPQPTSKAIIQQEDDNIRRLLRYYHIDDGDLFEVSDGSAQRLVLVHPERPLPPYIQHDKQLLQRLQPGLYCIFHYHRNKVFPSQ